MAEYDADSLEALIVGGHRSLRPEAAATPRFKPGDRVRARNIHPLGHTRLPRYARGREGVITRIHGPHVFPDSNAMGRGEDPRILYSVRFEGRALWDAAAGPRDCLHLDLWEPYLEPVPDGAR